MAANQKETGDDVLQALAETRTPSASDGDDVLAAIGFGPKPPTTNEPNFDEAYSNKINAKMKDFANSDLKSWGMGAGLTRTGMRELYNRIVSLGKEGVGTDEWAKAKRGEATSMSDVLSKGRTGMGYGAGKSLGILIDSALDPFAHFMSGKGSEVNEGVQNPLRALLQKDTPGAATIEEGAPSRAAVSNAIDETGNYVYRQPFNEADIRNALKRKNMTAQGRHSYSDLMRESRVGEIGDSAQDILKKMDDVGQREYAKSSGAMSGLSLDLAPNATSKITQVTEDKARNYLKDIVRSQAADSGLEAKEIDSLFKPVFDHIETAPIEEFIPGGHGNSFMKQLRDESSLKMNADLKNGLLGGPFQQENTIKTIKSLAPEWESLIDENAAKFEQGKSQEAKEWFDKLIDIISRGKSRSIEDVKEMSKFAGSKMAGSETMKTNQYMRGGKFNTKQAAHGGNRNLLENMIESEIKSKKGSEALGQYNEGMKNYSTFAGGRQDAEKAFIGGEKRPFFTGIDRLITGHPLVLAAKKAADLTFGRYPRASTAAGLLIKDASKTNAWDNLLRQMLYKNAQGDDNGKN